MEEYEGETRTHTTTEVKTETKRITTKTSGLGFNEIKYILDATLEAKLKEFSKNLSMKNDLTDDKKNQLQKIYKRKVEVS